jgi:hypothetical protein
MLSASCGLFVEGLEELIEAALLLQEVLRCRPGGFLLERQVHTLVAGVLLRMSGLDALDVDRCWAAPEASCRDALPALRAQSRCIKKARTLVLSESGQRSAAGR